MKMGSEMKDEDTQDLEIKGLGAQNWEEKRWQLGERHNHSVQHASLSCSDFPGGRASLFKEGLSPDERAARAKDWPLVKKLNTGRLK